MLKDDRRNSERGVVTRCALIHGGCSRDVRRRGNLNWGLC